ncbi:hypothetical protein A0H76_2065 [Hepatospora eriocheir]|uniref:Uncharacterized protein n=1 Tax=Hepatospora eriocheir TaxID=1081669 RepID=A0A1X0QFW6_9MICR|nr:hypothetical protein A0H76_2065 [Hepatospora eriocheir]
MFLYSGNKVKGSYKNLNKCDLICFISADPRYLEHMFKYSSDISNGSTSLTENIVGIYNIGSPIITPSHLV